VRMPSKRGYLFLSTAPRWNRRRRRVPIGSTACSSTSRHGLL